MSYSDEPPKLEPSSQEGSIPLAELECLKAELAELRRGDTDRAFLAAIVESSQDSVVTVDFRSIITSWNHGAERVYGYSASEVVGKPLTMLTLPKDLADVLGKIDAVRQSQTVGIYDTVRVRKSGREIVLEIMLSPVKNRRGEVIGVSTVARDVTDRRRAEELLRAQEEQFRRAIEEAPIPIIMHAEDGRVLQISRTWTELTGYTQEQMQTFDAWLNQAYGPGADAVRDHMHGLFAGNLRRLETELEVKTLHGDSRCWAFSASAPGSLHDGRRFIIGMALDITARKAAEQEIRSALQEAERARAEAEAATKAKDQFLAVISHELRTPLTPVLMAVRTISRDKNLPQGARDALEMIQRNVRAEASLVDDLLDVARFLQGKMVLTCESLDLHEVIHRAIEVVTPDMEQKGQHLTCSLDALEHSFTGDSKRLQQVFWNLLKNASKFTPQDGSISIHSRQERSRIVVIVTDNGIGFEPEAANRIFSAFEQASRDVTRAFGGLGLGLAIAKWCVEAHGGTIHAESEGAGRGASFVVELPLERE